MTLYLTTAARNQLAAVAGPALGALTLTRLQAGSGEGPGGATDAGRAALRTPQDAAVVVELEAPDGTLAVSAEIAGTADYDVTEAGLFGRVGAGAEILVGYWSDGGTVLAGVADGGTLELAATLGIQDVTGPAVALSQDVPGPPGLPGDCAQTEAELATCAAARQTAENDLAASEATLAIRNDELAACEAARDSALAALMASDAALAGEHLVTAPGTTVFVWPWAAATRARVALLSGEGGDGGDLDDDRDVNQVDAGSGGSGGPSLVRSAGVTHRTASGPGGRGAYDLSGGHKVGRTRGRHAAAIVAQLEMLDVGDEIEITVGLGGPGGSGEDGGSDGADGDPGWVLIVPRG